MSVSYTHLDVYKRQEYEPLFDCAKEIIEKQHKKAHYIVCDTYVTMTDGTGIVDVYKRQLQSRTSTFQRQKLRDDFMTAS